MATSVRSYSKINLGLAIGPPRADGFHSLVTLYQTLALHDLVTVSARPAAQMAIRISSNHPHVPLDSRNTVWKMVEAVLSEFDLVAEVELHIQKNLPIQGGMGAGSANAAAALIGICKELALDLPIDLRLQLAAQIGSDVPLFLIGGSVLGADRGQRVAETPMLTLAGASSIPCVIALPGIGVSTPAAFREWDAQLEAGKASDLHDPPVRDTIEELSRTYSSVFRPQVQTDKDAQRKSGASGIIPDPSPAKNHQQDSPEKPHGLSREQRHTTSGIENDLAENSLLALVRTGIENDFETVVFPQYPLLREIKRLLMGTPASGNGNSAGQYGQAIYAALSGSGSALFGLYRTTADAAAARQRLQQHGVRAVLTMTMPRERYWAEMFAR